MAKLQIDLSGRGGLSKKFAGDIVDAAGAPELRYLAEDGQMVQGTFNPIRKFGYMAPVPGAFTTVTESDATDNFTKEWRATIYDEVNNLIFAGEHNNLMWKGTGGTTSSWSAAFTQITAGATVKITDLEIYMVNGVKNLFTAYQKTGGGDISISSIVSNPSSFSTNHTWLSATVANPFNTAATSDVFMRVADNGFMYIFDNNAIHKIDGTTGGGANGTATANVVVFPVGTYCVDAVDWRGYMWTAIQTYIPTGIDSFNQISASARVAGVYVWDRKSTIVGSVDFIPMNGVKEIKRLYTTTTGELRAIVVSSQRLTQIRRYKNNTFETIVELGTQAYPRFRDSVGYMGDMVVWFGFDGYIYAHGSITIGEKEGLYIIGDTTALVGASPSNGSIVIVDSSGSATAPRDGILWSALSSGATIYNRYLYPNSTGVAPLAGSAYTPVKFLPKLSTVNHIDIYCAPTASSAATAIGTVVVYLNQSTTAFKTHSVTMAQASRGYISIPIDKPFVNSVQLKITWDTGTTIGTSDFLPSTAIVDYSPTGTVGK